VLDGAWEMAQLKYIKSASEIPAGTRHVVVQYGASAAEIGHSHGVVVVAPSGTGQQGLEKAFERAQKIAERQGLVTVYVIDRRSQGRCRVGEEPESGVAAAIIPPR
jgi:hypothetical protein